MIYKVKYILATLLLLSIVPNVIAQKVFLATGGMVHFFSKTPLEDIEAETKSMTAVLTSVTNKIQFTVPMRTFKFDKSLMEEHFNEKYVESEKYPKAVFKGVINETLDWTSDTVAEVTATGTFELHGVTREVTEKGTLKIVGDKINLVVVFNIVLADYKIRIPKVVTKNIAEVIKVNIECDFVPYVKK
ncbi:MAG: YceI family protein [Bacteroidetes bacterium]|nr:YceI family protein [Bacteroidota bacterium]